MALRSILFTSTPSFAAGRPSPVSPPSTPLSGRTFTVLERGGWPCRQTSDDKIGYRNPPQTHAVQERSFGKSQGPTQGQAQSGHGARKDAAGKSGHQRERTAQDDHKVEAAVKQLVNKAASGDLRALHQLAALARSAEERSPEAPTAPGPPWPRLTRKFCRAFLARFEQQSKGGLKTMKAPKRLMNMPTLLRQDLYGFIARSVL